jgi:3-hydroxyisobutyrate dehydrogenase-like beta-hydroxyacid dehydrogenase
MHVSIIGTGNMGSAVASGLIDAGHRVTVYNRTRDKTRRLAARGAAVAESAAAAIEASEFTIAVLLDEASTRAVLLADDTRSALAGRSVISAAAMSPEEIIALAREIDAAGGSLSEVSITTYPAQVEARQSEFVLACAPAHAQNWRMIFADLGPKIYDVGAVGNASKVQMSMWLSYMFMTIAMAYPVAALERLGLPADVGRALLAGNPTLSIAGADDMVPEMVRRSYGTGGFSIDNMILSIDQAVAFAARLGLCTDVMSAIRGVYARAASMGLGPRDVAAVYEAVNPRN